MVPKVGRVIFLMANVVKRGKLIIKKGLQRESFPHESGRTRRLASFRKVFQGNTAFRGIWNFIEAKEVGGMFGNSWRMYRELCLSWCSRKDAR